MFAFIIEQFEETISEWKIDDNYYFETHNFQKMFQQVKNQMFVTIVGVPGSGKTATVRHIALKLQAEGYEIIPITDKNKLVDYCDLQYPQVFVIDDVLGVFGFNAIELQILYKYKKRIINPKMAKTKTLMTCRQVVFQNEKLSGGKHFLTKTNHVVHLNSDDNALTYEDKRHLLAKYKVNESMLVFRDMSLTSEMFPFLCKLFSKKKDFTGDGIKFFLSPVPCILKLLDKMKTIDITYYVSLVLLMMHGNTLTENKLRNENTTNDDFNEIKNNILMMFNMPPNTENNKFLNALSAMDGTYTRTAGQEFAFIHDSMIEIVAYHIGCQFPKLILQYMSSEYIANCIQVDTNNTGGNRGLEARVDNKHIKTPAEAVGKINLCIPLPEEHYIFFAERLLLDVENGEFYHVFMNDALRHPSVRDTFISEIENKEYDQLHSIFLSEVKETSRIVRSYHRVKYAYSHQMNQIFGKAGHNQYSAKAVSWVIYFGHFEILNSLLNRIIEEKGQVDDLFQTSYKHGPRLCSDINTEVMTLEQRRMLSFRWCPCLDSDLNVQGRSINSTVYELSDKCKSALRSDKTRIADTDMNKEQVTVEQRRLLYLACCSGDLTIVQLLLRHISQDIFLTNTMSIQDQCYRDTEPLIIACELGYLDIVRELLNAGANADFCAGFHTPIFVACEKGYLNLVKELISHGADVNFSLGHHTPILSALSKGHFSIVKELVEAKTKIDPSDNTTLTLLCEEGQLCLVEQFLTAGAKVNLSDGNRTPLIAACLGGYLSVVKKLIEKEADINLIDKNRTPLTSACLRGNISIVEELIKNNADVNINDGNRTPLIAACLNGHLDVVKKLLNMQADVNRSNGDSTPLTTACYVGQLSVVETLLEAEADVNLSDGNRTPLTAACEKGHVNVVMKLLENGAQVNQSNGNETPLTTACFMGQLDVIDELLKVSAEVNLPDSNNTPLTAACYNGNLSVIRKLIQSGANVNQIIKNKTPLTEVCLNGRLSLVKALILAGADVNLSNGSKTPLIVTCEQRYVDIVKELILAGAGVNLRKGHVTPLTTACEIGYVDIVKELILAGADVNLRNEHMKPLTTACKNGHVYVVQELIKAGANVNCKDEEKTPISAASCNKELHSCNDMKCDINFKDEKANSVPCCTKHYRIVQHLIDAGAYVSL